jgi:iron complex transport system substrate-binding protein
LTPSRLLARSLAQILVACFGLACCGCGPVKTAPHGGVAGTTHASGWPRTLTDDTGAAITLAAAPRRIVSLAPSNTEILFALGLGEQVVADTESCDYPPEAKNRSHIGGMSAGDLERIQVLLPDLVVAVGPINQKLVTALRTANIPTLVVQPRTTNDVFASIRLIGKATGREAEADALASTMKTRIDRVREVTSRAAHRPKTLIAYSDKPIYTSPPDSFIHDLVEVAGGDDIVQAPLPQNIISPAVVVERAPDVIICAPALRHALAQLPGLSIVPAIKNRRFFSTVGDAELTRPGPRIAPAVEQLARYLHPELYTTSANRASP